MSGDSRVLVDEGGGLANLVSGLHEIVQQFEGLQYALVGGIAVLVHVQGHRVTVDIDSVVRAGEAEAKRRLLAVAREGASDATVTLANGVPVDIMTVSHASPRPGMGRVRGAREHALRWAIDTAEPTTITTAPESPDGPVRLPVATAAALIALKCIAIEDPKRSGRKRSTDKLDLWRLLADDPVSTVEALARITTGPRTVVDLVRDALAGHMQSDPTQFRVTMGAGVGSPRDDREIEELWRAVVAPGLA